MSKESKLTTDAKELAQLTREHGRKLASGDVLPAIGFGTYALPDGTDAVKAVAQAVLCGIALLIALLFTVTSLWLVVACA